MEDDELKATVVKSNEPAAAPIDDGDANAAEEDDRSATAARQDEADDALQATRVAEQNDGPASDHPGGTAAASADAAEPAASSTDESRERTVVVGARATAAAKPAAPAAPQPLPPPRPHRPPEQPTPDEPSAPATTKAPTPTNPTAAGGTFGPTPFGVPLARTASTERTTATDEAKQAASHAPGPSYRLVGLGAVTLVAALVLGYLAVTALRPSATADSHSEPGPTPRTSASRSPSKPRSTAAPSTATTAPASASSVFGKSTPATARTRAPHLAACVFKAIDATAESADAELDFLCHEADAPAAIRRMTALAARARTAATLRMRWASLGWYRAAALQLARSRCCGTRPALQGPAVLAACEIDAALAAIDTARTGPAMSRSVAAYGKAVDCLFKAQAAQLFGMVRRPAAHQARAYRQLAGL